MSWINRFQISFQSFGYKSLQSFCFDKVHWPSKLVPKVSCCYKCVRKNFVGGKVINQQKTPKNLVVSFSVLFEKQCFIFRYSILKKKIISCCDYGELSSTGNITMATSLVTYKLLIRGWMGKGGTSREIFLTSYCTIFLLSLDILKNVQLSAS